jgi:quercetin dioxygenase-like cupin family protein
MNVTRFSAAPDYVAPNHFDMRCVRLQGKEAGPSESIVLSCSTIQPGGYIPLSASPLEKLYLVIEGEVTLSTETQSEVFKRFDSCRIAPNEAREIRNASDAVAMIVLAMPVAPAA